MKTVFLSEPVRLSRCLVAALTILFLASSASSAGALTATAVIEDPTGNTYSGKGSSSDLEKSKKEAKRDSRDSADKACKKFCSEKGRLVCSSVIEEPSEPTCSNMGSSSKPKYECSLSAAAGDANHGCKLTSCTCCSFAEGEPLLN